MAPHGTAAPHGRRFRVPALLRARRAAFSRFVFRVPIVLYRLGLGRLLDHEFLLLTHAGRRTGRVHETVLKVLRYDPETGECVVAAAWGKAADWYRNIQARPALAVTVGGDRYVPEQRMVPTEEAFAVFADWIERQHWFAALMLGQIGRYVDGTEDERRRLVAGFPFIGLRPAAGTAGRAASRNSCARAARSGC
jgi:deazaflavin-dependent oxidoreductase (nitroreductase family)